MMSLGGIAIFAEEEIRGRDQVGMFLFQGIALAPVDKAA